MEMVLNERIDTDSERVRELYRGMKASAANMGVEERREYFVGLDTVMREIARDYLNDRREAETDYRSMTND